MSSLEDLASKLGDQDFPVKVVPTPKRVRGVLNGKYIFDTTEAKLVWEHKYFPHYWIPKSDFLSSAKFEQDKSKSGGESSLSQLTVGDKSVSTLLVSDTFKSELAGLVKIDFKALDALYEEQAQVLYHPKDPYHRVDILPTGRKVRVEIDGVVVADTEDQGGVFSLWETNLPGRWYLPRTAVNWEYLKESETHTGCPYKGEASYYNAVINGKEHKDVVWWYKNPTLESALIAGLLCFYPDKVDTWVDGKAIEKIGMPSLTAVKKQEESGQVNGSK
ncbi:hypothetical protein LTR10_014820 [Elasticomyces elasticus]|uniref:DUF427 domain-containing protein n=1 Tax=Exophiala sideris TaxID=1016849 RepID=A0ABR0JFV8_9EURO|nr:hypothetical protein LTR10_014820 [Elasticomyces elasticus]KAK5025663.1 hypothetical protein LTS07_007867 [Exophiala sideris]KAK5033128.1 hypothetical protein LTR13_007093 [Exophiala sideris]KAK5063613.1 hypothetical protein LTR69_004319 [Exophiala sideris]KAK5180554.1 hypothetical protein LTR44_006868 [Eurotiomycetes sp. CCFEE 6388]